VDAAAREAAYHRMMRIMAEQSPCVFLFGLPSIYGRAKALSGWTPPADKILRLTRTTIS
jgi:peptide/nickel transport system substrate-binding protein